MDKRFIWMLHLLGATALAVVIVLGVEIWSFLKPIPTPRELLETQQIIENRRANPPLEIKKNEKKEIVTDDVAIAKEIIKTYILTILRNSNYTFKDLSREQYATAIAEAVIAETSNIEEAFWFTGLVKTESTFKITARPGKLTNSSARGFCQIIWRYHGKFLEKHGIRREELESDINKSIRAGVLVFRQYQKRKYSDGCREKALRLYRSKSATDAQQAAYLKSVKGVSDKLTEALKKELKSV